MSIPTPEWVKLHGGELRQSKDGRSWLLYLDGQPQYLVLPVPADGKFSCRVSETINGRRLDDGAIYPTLEDAARGGLEELRQKLGW
jgi:hypothetical protein